MNVNVNVEKHPYFGTVAKIPELNSDFPDWYFGLEAQIFGAGIGTDDIENFLDSLTNMDFESLGRRDGLRTEGLKNLEYKIYAEVIKCMQNCSASKHIKTIKGSCTRGSGRQVVRKICEIYQYKIAKIATKASIEMVDMKCETVHQVAKYIRHMKDDLEALKQRGTPAPDDLIYALMKKKMKPYRKDGIEEVRAVFAEYDASKDVNKKVEDLIDSLETFAEEYEDETQQEEGGKKKKGATGGPKKKCKGCGKENHDESK